MRNALVFAALLAGALSCKKKDEGACKVDIDCRAGWDCRSGRCVEREVPSWMKPSPSPLAVKTAPANASGQGPNAPGPGAPAAAAPAGQAPGLPPVNPKTYAPAYGKDYNIEKWREQHPKGVGGRRYFPPDT